MAQRDAIAILKQDHREIRKLLKRLADTTARSAKMREKLLAEIEIGVKVHAKIEEEIFYPAFKNAVKKQDEDLFYEATEEHHVVDMVLPELLATRPASPQFGAKAKVLKELIEHHADEEEKQMFVKAKRSLDARTLRELGGAIEARKATLLAQWKNPVMRPLKKLHGAAEKLLPTKLKNLKAGG